jgi:aromatic ring hydroxylase
MWDSTGTEFGSRHALYERNYFGNHKNIRTEVIAIADMMGQSAKYKASPSSAWPNTTSTAGLFRI